MAALLILREKVLKPVLAGAGKAKLGRPPKQVHAFDVHYNNLQREGLSRAILGRARRRKELIRALLGHLGTRCRAA